MNLSEFSESDLQYKLVLNKAVSETADDNFGDFIAPVFLRPLELLVFDGCAMNIDSDKSLDPVETGFADLSGTADAF